MPELPEVETARRAAQKRLPGRSIAGLYVARDPIVFCGVSPRAFKAALFGRTIVGFCRKGKYLWMILQGGPCVLFHFGMTGGFSFYEDRSERPAFCKLEVVTDDGQCLAVTNKRRLGRIRLIDDPLGTPPVSRLGYDVLCDPFGTADVAAILQKRRAPVKAVLLDQQVFAGVGNWIADEVLYQAGVDPRCSAHILTQAQISRICRCLKRIVKKAVEADADPARYPRSWLFHFRWGRNSEAVDYRGRPICFARIGGRTTAWVPAKQGSRQRGGLP